MKTTIILALVLTAALPLRAQEPPAGAGAVDTPQRQAQNLDRDGKGAEARVIWQRLIDNAVSPESKAAMQRRMAMSFGFEHNCAGAVRYEEMVIAYWVTREKEEPQNAFYQQGEMANEAARVCIDAGDLATAERMYLRGAELGNKEPEPRTHPRSLWDYRTAHARARLAAQRGNQAEALKQVALARKILDSDSAMAGPQERFFPYLLGYVALFTNDLKTAEAELVRALAIRANETDPFQNYLLAMTWEKMGQADKAKAQYQKSYDLSTAHNPPAAFTRTAARKKIGSS